ncbi:hypothetical protein ACWGB8_23840 [Kitasatospora sp. NPDC054939]
MVRLLALVLLASVVGAVGRAATAVLRARIDGDHGPQNSSR